MKPESMTSAEHAVIDDVEIHLHAELDHKTFSFAELVNLNVGSLLQLGRPTGENVDIYAEDVLLGSGEILIVDTTLAVRIADLRDRPSPPKSTSQEGP